MEIEDILNDPLYQKYPGLYTTLTTNKVNKRMTLEVIDALVDKVLNSEWTKKRYKTSRDIEVGLKVLIIRANDYFPNISFLYLLKILKPYQYSKDGADKIIEISGKRHFNLIIALIQWKSEEDFYLERGKRRELDLYEDEH